MNYTGIALQNKSFEVSSHSIDIVKGDSMIVTEPEQSEAMEIFSEDSNEGGGEEKENRLDKSSSNISSETPRATRKRKIAEMKDSSVVLRRVRHPRAMKKIAGSKLDDMKQEKLRMAPFSSPDFKLPQPTLGHSTPGDIGPSLAPRRDSLFGFEALESPLVLSPVQSISFLADQDADMTTDHNKSLEESKRKSSSVKKLLGTYDIPLKKPTPRNRKGHTKQKTKRVSIVHYTICVKPMHVYSLTLLSLALSPSRALLQRMNG